MQLMQTSRWMEIRSWPAAAAAVALGLISLVILTRNVLHHPPTYDELLHILAARGVAATGEPAIAGGIYERAELFTRAVSAAHRVVPDELMAARVPALLGALLLVSLVGGWATRKIGFAAGALAALLLATHPLTIDLAVFARFYTLHALAVFAAFVLLYECSERLKQPSRAAGFMLAAIVCLAAAYHLQVTTVIAVAAIVGGIGAGAAAEQWRWVGPLIRRRWIPLAAVGVLAAAAGGLVLMQIGALDTFKETPLWSSGAAGRPNFYNRALGLDTPLFWPLVPIAALLLCIARPKAGIALGLSALIALAAHSLAAAKATRYVYYALPMLSIVLGAGLVIAGGIGKRAIDALSPRLASVSALLIAGVACASFVASQELYRTARLALGTDSYRQALSYGDEPDWSSERDALRALAAGADAVVVSNGMKALFYLGRYDFELNASIVAETDTQKEFGIDTRTGARAVGSAESLRRIFDEHRRVLVIIESEKLGVEYAIPASAVSELEAACGQARVLSRAQLRVWECSRKVAA